METGKGSKPIVIIVGAGLAGLAAANTLQSSGIVEVKLLEAQSEPGGRIKTLNFNGHLVEMGAQWLHSDDCSLYEYAKEKNLLRAVSWGEALGDFFRINGEKVSPQVVREVDEVVAEVMSSCVSFYSSRETIEAPHSFEDYLRGEFVKYLEARSDSEDVKTLKWELLDWHIRFQVIDNSCADLKKLSAKYLGQFAPFEPDHFCLKGGYSGVVRSLTHSLSPGTLVTCFPVERIRWSDGGGPRGIVRVLSEGGQEVWGHHVIVTCSVGVLKACPDLFDPPLPSSHRKALSDLGFDAVNKIFLFYKKPWWNESTGFQLVWDSDEMTKRLEISDGEAHWTRYLTGFDSVQDSPKALCGWVGGRGAREVETLSENDIGAHCTLVLRKFLAKRDIPPPVNVIRSQWASNKYIRGGYSHIATVSDREDSSPQNVLETPIFTHSLTHSVPRIFLAGEAVHQKQYSTAHGAVASGQSQALKLMSYLDHVQK